MIIESSGTTKYGHPYLAVVMESTGHRNGYVGVLPGSKLYSVHYDGIDNIVVHGGLTYSGLMSYIVGAENPYYFGFDCNHLNDSIITIDDMQNILVKCGQFTAGDIERIMLRYHQVHNIMQGAQASYGETNTKSLDYVLNEIDNLSKQLKEKEELLNVDD